MREGGWENVVRFDAYSTVLALEFVALHRWVNYATRSTSGIRQGVASSLDFELSHDGIGTTDERFSTRDTVV